MKTLSKIGVMAGIFLLLLFSYLFFLFAREMGVATILIPTAGMIISVYVMIFSVTVAGQHK